MSGSPPPAWPCPTPIEVNQNTDAARRFEPMNQTEIHELRAALLDAGPIMCAACDGRCGRAAGTDARLGDLTRLPDLPRASWRPPLGPRSLCPAHGGRAKLARSRPRRRPCRLPDQARLRPALAGGRSPARLNRREENPVPERRKSISVPAFDRVCWILGTQSPR